MIKGDLITQGQSNSSVESPKTGYFIADNYRKPTQLISSGPLRLSWQVFHPFPHGRYQESGRHNRQSGRFPQSIITAYPASIPSFYLKKLLLIKLSFSGTGFLHSQSPSNEHLPTARLGSALPLESTPGRRSS
ncbi:G-protein coupled receptor 15 [Striga asiatica]|uniref:G-protein coupled receptor 15 n=1 Tax=Striga asiatica TaxID=4170 RepID=A0A5A7QL36_STRAF|nr:G-protein coupled receptor 15 [Striga asiatica]